MNGRMEKSYFEEKKCFALGALSAAIAKSQEVQSLIESTRYEMPNLTDPSAIHEIARAAQMHLRSARRDYEKTRWADAITELEFEDWLRHHGHHDLAGR